MVADALSRKPFAKPVSRRLLEESYLSLTQEAEKVNEDSVQDVFRFSCQSQSDRSMTKPILKGVYDAAEVRVLCKAHCDWIEEQNLELCV